MNPSAIWIRRPVMTTLVMLGILMFGMLAYPRLPVSDLPNVDYPTISVSASLPGASPETMAVGGRDAAREAVLDHRRPRRDDLDEQPGRSRRSRSSSTLDRDIDAAAQDVQAAIAQTLRQLPHGILPPSYQKVNPADSPILFLALTSTHAAALRSSTSTPRPCSRSASRRWRAWPRSRCSARRSTRCASSSTRRRSPRAAIGIDEVARRRRRRQREPADRHPVGHRPARYSVESHGQLENASEFRPLIVAYRNGAPVRLRDLGRVIDGVAEQPRWRAGSTDSARHRARRPAPAGHQHGRGRRRGQAS